MLTVKMIGHTITLPEVLKEITEGVWEPEYGDEGMDHGSALCEFAGRACYESWKKPNPATATNKGYLENIMRQAHFSVMEHASVSFHIGGVSRSCTHEVVRHRHHSPSQLSQRFAAVKKAQDGKRAFVVAPLYEQAWEDDPLQPISETQGILELSWSRAVEDYERLVGIWLPRVLARGVDPHRARKMVREAARGVLPNMTPTALVLTANHRSWRHFLMVRGSIHADAEIRALALEVFNVLSQLEPNLYQDIGVEQVDGQVCIAHREPR